jgi:hypothetical protein
LIAVAMDASAAARTAPPAPPEDRLFPGDLGPRLGVDHFPLERDQVLDSLLRDLERLQHLRFRDLE